MTDAKKEETMENLNCIQGFVTSAIHHLRRVHWGMECEGKLISEPDPDGRRDYELLAEAAGSSGLLEAFRRETMPVGFILSNPHFQEVIQGCYSVKLLLESHLPLCTL